MKAYATLCNRDEVQGPGLAQQVARSKPKSRLRAVGAKVDQLVLRDHIISDIQTFRALHSCLEYV
jgi:hypothetical protein